MAATRATESPSASHDSAPHCMSNTSMLGSSGPSLVTVDLLANRSDPLNPPDLSDRRGSRLRPTSPTQQTPEGDENVMTSSDDGPGGSMPKNKKNDGDTVVDNSGTPPLRLDKGKAPETGYLLSAPEQGLSIGSDEEGSLDELQERNPAGPATEDERSDTSAERIITAASEEDFEISNRTMQAEPQDSSYPSSLFDEAQDHDVATPASALAGQVVSWKQKGKQKADPVGETGSSSEVSEEQQPFRPLNIGDPDWEKSAGRPPQKLPIRFRDAVGRNFLFPWEKAKTWTGMRGLINNCLLQVDVLGPHVMAGRYDLSITLPFPMDSPNEIMPPVTPVSEPASTSATETPGSPTVAGSSSAPESAGSANASRQQQQQQQQQHRSSFVVLPELWEDTIEPGMLVVQRMWPPPTPNYIAPPAQPSPPQSHHLFPAGPTGPVVVPIPGRGRGARGRGRGGGAGTLFGGRGGVGGNAFPPPPPPGSSRPPHLVVVNVESSRRGKTRKRQDRP